MPIRFSSLLLLVLLAGIAYIPVGNAGFIWDDADGYIVKNPTLRAAKGLELIWFSPGATPQYYPMVFTTFWVEYQLWALNPTGYHITNIVLHIGNSILLWLLMRRLEVPGAWLIAAIFSVHPVHVESVAWISERKNVLSGMFYLTSFLAFLRFSDPTPRDEVLGTPRVSWRWYAVSFVLFVFALLSKTVTCSLPAVLVLVYWWKRSWPTRREILALLPMFVVGFVLAMYTAYFEREMVKAQGDDWNFTPIDRCLIAGRALWFYAGKLLWPCPLMFNYPRWHIDAGDPWQYAYPLAAILVVLILAYRARRRLAAKQWGRAPLVAVLIFAGTLLPALGFVNVYPMRFYFAADHFQYLASIPMIALFVTGLCQLRRSWTWLASKDGQIAAVLTTGGLLAVLAFLTWNQCLIYRDLFTLWSDTVDKNPDAYLAQFNLGTLAMKDGTHRKNLDLAIRCFERVARVKPDYAGLYTNWGIALGEKGDNAGAYAKFTEALQRDPNDPLIYYCMGEALHGMNELEEARVKYAQAEAKLLNAVRKDANDPEALHLLGCALLGLQKPDEAIVHLRRAVELEPLDARFRETLAKAIQANKRK